MAGIIKIRSMEMSEDEVKQLAFDVACDFFKEDQLCTRYDLDVRQLRNIKKQQPFLKEVDEVKRLLADDGSEFVVLAKGMAKDCLNTCHDIAKDAAANDTSKINASKIIFGMARLNQLPAKGGESGVAGQGSLIIHTNLSLNQNPAGAYTLEAQPKPEAIEGEFSTEYVDAPSSRYADLL